MQSTILETIAGSGSNITVVVSATGGSASATGGASTSTGETFLAIFFDKNQTLCFKEAQTVQPDAA